MKNEAEAGSSQFYSDCCSGQSPGKLSHKWQWRWRRGALCWFYSAGLCVLLHWGVRTGLVLTGPPVWCGHIIQNYGLWLPVAQCHYCQPVIIWLILKIVFSFVFRRITCLPRQIQSALYLASYSIRILHIDDDIEPNSPVACFLQSFPWLNVICAVLRTELHAGDRDKV